MDGTRNRRRSDGARHRPANFSTACRTAAEKRGLQPHRFRYWLTAVPDERRDEKIVEGCELYATAAQRAKRGERIISSDELTGVQALSRKHPDLPMQAGHVLRREFEYIRHGTLSWFINARCRHRTHRRTILGAHPHRGGCAGAFPATDCQRSYGHARGTSSWIISTSISPNR